MSRPVTRSTDFTRTRKPKARRTRDPLGKSALFSESEPASGGSTSIAPERAERESHGRGATQLFSRATPRPGTLVVDCSRCERRTRVTYAEFAALHVPVWLWIPTPARTHRHWLRCPACQHRTWLRARWLASSNNDYAGSS